MRAIDTNHWNTTELVLSVMARVADRLGLNIEDYETADKLYFICSDLESWGEGEGFGTSDFNAYVQRAKDEFKLAN